MPFPIVVRKLAYIISVGSLFWSIGCFTNIEGRLNERQAVASMKAIKSAEKSFYTSNGRYGTLEELFEANLIDKFLAGGAKQGYRYQLLIKNSSYEVTAVPEQYGAAGDLSFYLNDTGIIRARDRKGEKADQTDAPIVEQ